MSVIKIVLDTEKLAKQLMNLNEHQKKVLDITAQWGRAWMHAQEWKEAVQEAESNEDREGAQRTRNEFLSETEVLHRKLREVVVEWLQECNKIEAEEIA